MFAGRFLPLVVCLTLAALGPSRAAAQARRTPGSNSPLPTVEHGGEGRLDRLERWLKAAARHAPGEDDEALDEVAGWTNADLKDLWVDANILSQMMRNVRAERFTVSPAGGRSSSQVRFSKAQIRRMRALACAASGVLVEPECMAMGAGSEVDRDLQRLAVLSRASKLRGDDNYILRRGALLHGDAAMLAPRASPEPFSPAPSAGPERLRMDIADGREIDLGQSAVHWDIAHMLLDFVKPPGSDRPAPGRDEMVRQWYRATAAWMQLREDHDKQHLDRARGIFPSDPDILFLSGCQREVYAGAPIQAAARSAVLPTGVTLDVTPERTELRAAEAFFQRALATTPDHAEARLHHGRVLALLGHHAEAAAELRRAAATVQGPQLLYYTQLFLGAEEEALGNREAAGAAYERAAALAPRAQSPLLALSQLARRSGDRPGALRAAGRLFALPAEELSEHDDPWWSYYVSQGRDADDLLEAMRQPFLAERLP